MLVIVKSARLIPKITVPIIRGTNWTIEVLDGISNEVFDIRPAAEYQVGFSVDYKWFAVGFGFTPKFLLNSDKQDELSNSSSYTASLNFFFSDRWRQEFKYNYYKVTKSLRIQMFHI